MSYVLYHPLPPPVNKLPLFLSLLVCRRSVLLTEGGKGGGRAKSYDNEKAWSSIYHSILSAPTIWCHGSHYYAVLCRGNGGLNAVGKGETGYARPWMKREDPSVVFDFFYIQFRRVTKICRLSLLTNSALLIRVQMQGEGGSCGVSANEYSCAHHVTWNPNKICRSISILNL